MRRRRRTVAAAPGAAALLVASFLALGTAAARGPLDDTPVWLVANRELRVSTPAGSGVLRLYLSQDWNQPQPAITRAIVTIHGVVRDADIARTVAEVGRAASGLDPESVLLVEPQFLDDIDVAADKLPAETLRWGHFGWEAGDDAHGPAPISSFAALDAILARLADRASFPALKTVVIAGHSGGGQLVQRYAVAGHGEDAVTKAGIHLRYLVADPSSYVYFSSERPAGHGFAFFRSLFCPAFNRWKFGMRELPPYLAGADPEALEAAYVARDVVYLLGGGDDDPNNPSLDKSCMAEAQGPDRLARGLAYFRYLKQRHPTGLAHRLLQVPDVGHNIDGMFNSPCGLAALYDLPGCDGG